MPKDNGIESSECWGQIILNLEFHTLPNCHLKGKIKTFWHIQDLRKLLSQNFTWKREAQGLGGGLGSWRGDGAPGCREGPGYLRWLLSTSQPEEPIPTWLAGTQFRLSHSECQPCCPHIPSFWAMRGAQHPGQGVTLPAQLRGLGEATPKLLMPPSTWSPL